MGRVRMARVHHVLPGPGRGGTTGGADKPAHTLCCAGACVNGIRLGRRPPPGTGWRFAR